MPADPHHPRPHKSKILRGRSPSFCIMAFKVVRGTPRRVAAALITPPVSRRTRIIYSRSMSASVPPAVSTASGFEFRQGSTERRASRKDD